MKNSIAHSLAVAVVTYQRLRREAQGMKGSIYATVGSMLTPIADRINALNCGAFAAEVCSEITTLHSIDGVDCDSRDLASAAKTMQNVLSSYMVYFAASERGANLREEYTFAEWCALTVGQNARAKIGVEKKIVERPAENINAWDAILDRMERPKDAPKRTPTKNEEIQQIIRALTGVDYSLDDIQAARFSDETVAAPSAVNM